MEHQPLKGVQAEQIDFSTLVAAVQALTMNIGLSAKALTTIATSLSALLIT